MTLPRVALSREETVLRQDRFNARLNIAAINAIDSGYIYLYGLFIFLMVYAFTELMDGNPYAVFWEIAKNALGFSMLYRQGDWFGSDALMPGLSYFVAGYFIVSTIVVIGFCFKQRTKAPDKSIA